MRARSIDRRALLIMLVLASALSSTGLIAAQTVTLGEIEQIAPPGMEATQEELAAWNEVEAGRNIKGRERAAEIVRRNPDSYVGHFVLGYVYHYGEANAPRALFHTQRAFELFTQRWGLPPREEAPLGWHTRIIQELVWIHGDLEHYEEQLRWMALHNELYDPDFMAEMAWPLMKLRRFDDARRAARAAEQTGQARQVEIALNALCAVEFEAGDNRASYAACRAAMDLHGADPTVQSAVDFTNFAEAARSVFRLDEAEYVALEATRARVSWYGLPWIELAELYVREARFPEALDALKQIPTYRAQRPPHVQDADRNESRRALAEFFLVIGRSQDALRITQRAVVAPDRRGHNSRDPAQDVAIAGMLDRRARLMEADRAVVGALGGSVPEVLWAYASAASFRWEAWSSGRTAARALADDDRLVGTFMIGTARSAVLPPWLAGELVEIVGPGVALAAIQRARLEDRRELAPAYYDAFEAEAALRMGDPARANELSRRALAGLQPAEALLIARMHAIAAESARQSGEAEAALASYDDAFQIDPGVFVRMGLTVPVRIIGRGSVGEQAASLLAWSPRLDVDPAGLRVEVDADAHRGRACLYGASGAVLGCADVEANAAEASDAFAARLARELHAAAFAPRIDLSAVDANSLDGSNTVSRRPLETLFGTPDVGADVEVELDQ